VFGGLVYVFFCSGAFARAFFFFFSFSSSLVCLVLFSL